MNWFKKHLGKKNWETVFSGDVKGRSGDNKLQLQVDRERNLYRCIASGGAFTTEIPLFKLVETFPEVKPIIEKERIKE